MRSEPRTARWFPFVTFLAGVVLTASAVIVLDPARGQEPAPEAPRQQDAGAAENPNAGGAEMLYNAFKPWKENLPALEEVGELSTPEENARERFKVAGEALQVAIHRFLEPPRAPYDHSDRSRPILEWSRCRIDAHLDMVETDEERIRVLQSEIAHTRAMISPLREISRNAGSFVTDTSILGFEHYQLELEAKLAELTNGGE